MLRVAIFLLVALALFLPFNLVTYRQLVRIHPRRRPLVIAASLVGFYQAIVPLRIERVPIALDQLPPELEGKRLVLLGDLHVGLFSRPSRLHTIFSTAAALKPDAVLILGDLLDDDPHFIPK